LIRTKENTFDFLLKASPEWNGRYSKEQRKPSCTWDLV